MKDTKLVNLFTEHAQAIVELYQSRDALSALISKIQEAQPSIIEDIESLKDARDAAFALADSIQLDLAQLASEVRSLDTENKSALAEQLSELNTKVDQKEIELREKMQAGISDIAAQLKEVASHKPWQAGQESAELEIATILDNLRIIDSSLEAFRFDLNTKITADDIPKAPTPEETAAGLNTLAGALDYTVLKNTPEIPEDVPPDVLRDILLADTTFLNRLKDEIDEQIRRIQIFGSTGSTGATAFTQLTDVPNTYVGSAGKAVVVNGTETGLTFAATAAGAYALEDFTATAGQTVYTLANPIIQPQRSEVYFINVPLRYGADYVIAGTQLTLVFTEYPIQLGDPIQVRYYY